MTTCTPFAHFSMSSLPLINLSRQLSGTVLALTTIINYTLIYLTLFHAHNLFGTYRHLIVTFAVFGIAFSCLEFVTRPILHLHKSSLVLFTVESPLGTSDFTAKILLASFTGFHCSILTLLSIQFLYRYWSMFDCRRVRLFENAKISVWISGIILCGVLWVIFSYNFMACDAFSRSYLRTEFWEKFRLDTRFMNCMSLIVIDYTIPADPRVRWPGAIYLLVLSIVLTVKLSVMLYCGARMAARVNKRSNFQSSKYQKQHAHFLKSLFLQLITPTCIVYLPTLFVAYAPLLNVVISVPNVFLMAIFTIYPALDGIIALYVVSDYRLALRDAFLRTFWCWSWKKEQKDTEFEVNMETLYVIK